jgi:hypothetical protein
MPYLITATATRNLKKEEETCPLALGELLAKYQMSQTQLRILSVTIAWLIKLPAFHDSLVMQHALDCVNERIKPVLKVVR